MTLEFASRIEDRYATVNGVRIHYRETPGVGGPLVCLHGITSNARAWDGIAAELAPLYRTIAPDLRGRGDSGKPNGPYGLNVHAADAVALMDQLGIDKAVVIGHSLGALIGMEFAATYPDRIRKLVLVDHGVNTSPETINALRPFWARLNSSYPSWQAFRDAMRASPAFPNWTPEIENYLQNEASLQPDGTVRHKVPAWVPERELTAAIGRDIPSYYGRIRCPTLVLRAPLPLIAEGDQVLTEAQAEMVARSVANGRWQNIPNTHHFNIVIGHPEQTTEAIRAFLAEG